MAGSSREGLRAYPDLARLARIPLFLAMLIALVGKVGNVLQVA